MSIALLTLPNIWGAFETSKRLREIRKIWQASKSALCDQSGGALLYLEGSSRGAEKFAERIKAEEFRKTKLVKISDFIKNPRRPNSFEKLGPSSKLKAVRGPNVSRAKMNRFFETVASPNLLKSSIRAIGGGGGGIINSAICIFF